MALIEPDADTLFLFDLENFSTGSQILVIDSSGSNNLLVTGSAFFITGPGNISSVRAMESNTFKKFGVTNTFLTASRGDYTIEAWLMPRTGHIDEIFWQGPNGSGETPDTNYTGQWTIGSDNLWDYFSEYGSGTNIRIAQTTGSIINDEWNHVALTRRVTGSNIACDFYRNGTLQETVEQLGSLPGDIAGNNSPNFTMTWDGTVRSVRFSNLVRSGSEISSSAARSDYDHDLDSNTISLWKMDESPTFPNRGTAAQHLSVTSNNSFTSFPLVADATDALAFINGAAETTNLLTSDLATIITSSDITIDFWFRDWDADADQTFAYFGASGETPPTNCQFSLRMTVARKFSFFAERSSGSNVGDGAPSYTTTASFQDFNKFKPTHYAIVRTLVTASSEIYLDFYVNGELFETSSGSSTIAIPDGGAGGYLSLGGQAGTGKLIMQQFRLSKRALTSTEIAETYQTGLSSSITSGVILVSFFRGVSGSQYVYFRSDEPPPPGITNITEIATFTD